MSNFVVMTYPAKCFSGDPFYVSLPKEYQDSDKELYLAMYDSGKFALIDRETNEIVVSEEKMDQEEIDKAVSLYDSEERSIFNKRLNGYRDCPHGGDTDNDCDGCVYSADYQYDEDTGECVKRE